MFWGRLPDAPAVPVGMIPVGRPELPVVGQMG